MKMCDSRLPPGLAEILKKYADREYLGKGYEIETDGEEGHLGVWANDDHPRILKLSGLKSFDEAQGNLDTPLVDVYFRNGKVVFEEFGGRPHFAEIDSDLEKLAQNVENAGGFNVVYKRK